MAIYASCCGVALILINNTNRTFGVLELDRNVNSAYQILGLGLAILTHKSDNGCRKINAYVVSLQLNDLDHGIVA